jgi:hypothetical protein
MRVHPSYLTSAGPSKWLKIAGFGILLVILAAVIGRPSSQVAKPVEPSVQVIVSLEQLALGAPMDNAQLTFRTFPKSLVPIDAVTDVAAVRGKVALANISQGAIVSMNQIGVPEPVKATSAGIKGGVGKADQDDIAIIFDDIKREQPGMTISFEDVQPEKFKRIAIWANTPEGPKIIAADAAVSDVSGSKVTVHCNDVARTNLALLMDTGKKPRFYDLSWEGESRFADSEIKTTEEFRKLFNLPTPEDLKRKEEETKEAQARQKKAQRFASYAHVKDMSITFGLDIESGKWFPVDKSGKVSGPPIDASALGLTELK